MSDAVDREGTGLTYEQYKRILDIFWEDGDYTQLQTSEELHQFAWNQNYDDGPEPFRWIIRQPMCDRGTALLVYWRSSPRWICQYKDRSEVPVYEYDSTDLEMYDLIKEIEARCLSGLYQRANFRFDPRNDERGGDYTSDYLEIEDCIPPLMLEPTPGIQLKRCTAF